MHAIPADASRGYQISPGTGLTEGYEPFGYWELNFLQEQSVLLTVEPSLQPSSFYQLLCIKESERHDGDLCPTDEWQHQL